MTKILNPLSYLNIGYHTEISPIFLVDTISPSGSKGTFFEINISNLQKVPVKDIYEFVNDYVRGESHEFSFRARTKPSLNCSPMPYTYFVDSQIKLLRNYWTTN